jgi:hypothetical protein
VMSLRAVIKIALLFAVDFICRTPVYGNNRYPSDSIMGICAVRDGERAI